jgi:hypothetical protein
MTQELRKRQRGAGRVGKGLRSSGDWATFREQEGGAILTPGLPELCLPSMQSPMGPPCIFRMKGMLRGARCSVRGVVTWIQRKAMLVQWKGGMSAGNMNWKAEEPREHGGSWGPIRYLGESEIRSHEKRRGSGKQDSNQRGTGMVSLLRSFSHVDPQNGDDDNSTCYSLSHVQTCALHF